jgi:hypothetical protein
MNHHGELEHFLRTATRGLWGKRKLEVREELESHLLERARKHELLGLSREGAISKSLGELGSAQVIRSGLQRTYWAKPIFSLIWLGLNFLGFTALPSSEQKRLPILDQSLEVIVISIPLARADMAQLQPIPLSKPGDTNFVPLPLARPPAKVPIKSR